MKPSRKSLAIHVDTDANLPGSTLTSAQAGRLTSDMSYIVNAWPDLLDRLAREGTSAISGMPKAKVYSNGLVLNEHISDTMREVSDWVWFLARVLLDETDWIPPKDHDTPILLAAIARTRIGHFTHHTDAQLALAVSDDARRLRGKVERAAYPSGVKVIPVHVLCLEHGVSDMGERVACCGEYTVRLDPEMPGLIPDMICSQDNGHRITPEQWQRAARKTSMNIEAMTRLLAAVARG